MSRAGIVDPDRYLEQQVREGASFDCDICGFPWPQSHLRLQSGLRVGVTCCWEPNGGEVERDEQRAAASAHATRLGAKEAIPPLYGATHGGEDAAGVTGWSPKPIELFRGGAAVAVTVDGAGFSATDTFVYGAAGITDAAAPLLVSSIEVLGYGLSIERSQWDLSLVAAGGMVPGKYDMTFNESVFRDWITVRQ